MNTNFFPYHLKETKHRHVHKLHFLSPSYMFNTCNCCNKQLAIAPVMAMVEISICLPGLLNSYNTAAPAIPQTGCHDNVKSKFCLPQLHGKCNFDDVLESSSLRFTWKQHEMFTLHLLQQGNMKLKFKCNYCVVRSSIMLITTKSFCLI